jgi:hypothetical protein
MNNNGGAYGSMRKRIRYVKIAPIKATSSYPLSMNFPMRNLRGVPSRTGNVP